MENNQRKFEEQDHPLKNTDHAFVKVGKNGEPVIPKEENKEASEPRHDDQPTTLDKR